MYVWDYSQGFPPPLNKPTASLQRVPLLVLYILTDKTSANRGYNQRQTLNATNTLFLLQKLANVMRAFLSYFFVALFMIPLIGSVLYSVYYKYLISRIHLCLIRRLLSLSFSISHETQCIYTRIWYVYTRTN